MKNLALAFCSIRPSQLDESICDARESEYYICLQQLKRVLPKSFDLVVCENTVDSELQIKHDGLRALLSETEMVATGSGGNIGTKNKGLGELFMLNAAISELDVSQYDNISYITARRFFTCPYVFERTEQLKEKALVSNPDFVFLDGRVLESYKGPLFNDMFFSMKTETMVEYAKYSMERVNYLSDNHIGSEYNLYDFVNENKIEYEWLDWLGLIRNAWEINGNTSDISNFHIS
jgi:hypothetical protein